MSSSSQQTPFILYRSDRQEVNPKCCCSGTPCKENQGKYYDYGKKSKNNERTKQNLIKPMEVCL